MLFKKIKDFFFKKQEKNNTDNKLKKENDQKLPMLKKENDQKIPMIKRLKK